MFELVTHVSRSPALPSWLADDLGVSAHVRLGAGEAASGPARRPRWPRRERVHPDASQLPLFDGLSKRDLRLVWRLSESVETPAGAVLGKPDRHGSHIFIVLDGEVDVVHDGEVVATRGPGSPLGQIAPIADPPRRATLRARTPVAARVADQRSFTRILGGVPQLQDRIEAIVEQQRVA